MKLKIGDSAPTFDLDTDRDSKTALPKLKGKKVVLFFYPKDDTPGCTKESCEFSNAIGDFEKKNALVFGISADDKVSHKAFVKKFNLTFPLLADPTHATCEAYGVWGKQSWGGKEYMGIARTTFVINENGKIHKIYENVNPVGHAEKVLQDL